MDQWEQRRHIWNVNIPNSDADQWNCKYQIRASQSLIDATESTGYIYLEIENYAFDEYIFIIIQPRNQFHDFIYECPINQITKIHTFIGFDHKYYIPIEYDIFVSFEPVGNSPFSPWDSSHEGQLRFKTKAVQEIDSEHLEDADHTIVERPQQHEIIPIE